MSKYALIAVAVVVVLGAGGYVYVRKHRSHSAQNTPEATGAKYEAQGVMTKEEYLRMHGIAVQTKASGTIADGDLDYLVTQCKDPKSSSTSPGKVHQWAGVAFTYLKTYGPGQRDKVVSTCSPLIKSQDPLDERVGLSIAQHVRSATFEKLAVPLLKSSDTHVSADAKKYLDAVGYKAPK